MVENLKERHLVPVEQEIPKHKKTKQKKPFKVMYHYSFPLRQIEEERLHSRHATRVAAEQALESAIKNYSGEFIFNSSYLNWRIEED